MYRSSLIALVIFIIGCRADTFWRPCASGPSPTQVTSSHCSGSECIVIRGGHLEMNVTFTPTTVETDLPVRLFMQAAGFPETEIEITTNHRNACVAHLLRDDVRVGCPTIPNVEHLWIFHNHLSHDMPLFQNVNFRFLLKEGEVLCYQAFGHLVPN